MSMVEKVAEAMSYADRMWEHSAIGNYEALARVAIAAMFDPNVDMLAETNMLAKATPERAKEIYQAMISAALNEDG
jgi:hypothetical protein